MVRLVKLKISYKSVPRMLSMTTSTKQISALEETVFQQTV